MATSEGSMAGIWGKISVWCLNHKEPVLLQVMQNEEFVKTPFYACPESGCANRMNLDDYQDIVFKFLDIISQNPIANYSNYSFNFKGHRHAYHVKVLKYSDKEIRIGIKNTTILGK